MNENMNYELLNQWRMEPQEKKGTFRFDGVPIINHNILNYVFHSDLINMIIEVKKYVELHDGADYKFIFVNVSTGRKFFFLDNLNDDMKKKFDDTDVFLKNYYTLILR